MPAPPDGPLVLLLGSRTGHVDFERFARAKEWILHDDRPSNGPKSAYEQIWVTADRGTAIHYMADPTPKERFVVVYGRGTGDVAFQMGAAQLDVQTRDDVFDQALLADSDPERITAVWRLAVVAKVYDEGVLDLLKSLYDAASDAVREAVINAIGYRGWQESREFLERVAAEDPSADLRRNAGDIIAAWWDASS
jgi:AcrR family transcriptional regulator